MKSAVSRREVFTYILLAGLLVGTLDIGAAFADAWLTGHTSPVRVLHYIASAAYGKEAFLGKLPAVIAGLVFHYIIAFSFTILFFFLFPWLKTTLKYNLLIAVLYGIFMWAFVRFCILPFTTLQLGSLQLLKVSKAILILIFAIGLPLSLIMNRFLFRSTDKNG